MEFETLLISKKTMKTKIIISPGFGAGFSTWNKESKESQIFLLTYPPFIDALEAGKEITPEMVETLQEEYKEKFRLGEEMDPYISTGNLKVVEVEGLFFVAEYDGYESLITLDDMFQLDKDPSISSTDEIVCSPQMTSPQHCWFDPKNTKNLAMLFRRDDSYEEEFEIAKRYFDVYTNRCAIPKDSLVIGRYSVLPFYKELEEDLIYNGSTLINSFAQHEWIASFSYYSAVKEFTPRTWTMNEFYTAEYEGPFVVKGATNSKKFQWKDLMFAADKQTAIQIAAELSTDSMIQYQDIIFREYIPLETIEYGIADLPFSIEYRFFFYKKIQVASAFYWSIAEEADKHTFPPLGARLFAQKVAGIVSDHANFYVLDVALKAGGDLSKEDDWILIEINDGCMSGLSMIDPGCFYAMLKQVLSD